MPFYAFIKQEENWVYNENLGDFTGRKYRLLPPKRIQKSEKSQI